MSWKYFYRFNYHPERWFRKYIHIIFHKSNTYYADNCKKRRIKMSAVFARLCFTYLHEAHTNPDYSYQLFRYCFKHYWVFSEEQIIEICSTVTFKYIGPCLQIQNWYMPSGWLLYCYSKIVGENSLMQF